MIAELKPYPEYRESEQLWVGTLPAHWEILPNRAIFEEVKERNHPDEEMLSVTITRGIIHQKALLENTSKKDSSNKDKSAYKLVCPRDIAYNKMRAWQGAIGASNYRGIISPAYVVMRLRGNDNPWYFHHLYRTPHFAKEAERWSYGITSDMWSLRPEHFKMIYTPIPPPDEQAAIVRFLDHVNRRIERTIKAKRKMIALLNEQKQVIIHRAVTRGLDPNVRLKPSSIPWLGDIPEHWEVLPMRHLLSFGPKNGVSPPASDRGGVMSFSISAVRDGRVHIEGNEKYIDLDQALARKYQIFSGDILLVRGNGNLALVAKCGIVDDCPDTCVYPDILIKLRPNDRMTPNFMVLSINSSYVCNQVPLHAKTANGAYKVSGTSVRALMLAVPPVLEQESIQAQLSRDLAQIDRIKTKITSEVTLLNEYRTRLIADVVTGKLDVREAAARLPDEAESLDSDEVLDDSAEIDEMDDDAEGEA